MDLVPEEDAGGRGGQEESVVRVLETGGGNSGGEEGLRALSMLVEGVCRLEEEVWKQMVSFLITPVENEVVARCVAG